MPLCLAIVFIYMPSSIREIRALIPNCLTKDRHAFRTQLKRASLKRSLEQQALLDTLAEKVAVSISQVELREGSCPTVNFPDLPISERREEISKLIDKHQVIILCGETGSGKTTQLPKICLELGRGFKGQIGHTQPRRLAAISVAQRIADELKSELGQAVGYKIRFQGKENQQTLVKLMTDGILLAEIKSDPFLSQYDTLILDEAHERSLNIDFLLGYMKWLLPKRPDLKLIVTSATIDPERFSRHFDGAPIINVSGRTYPVEMRYRPVGVDSQQGDEDIVQGIVNAADELHRERAGDMLVFLSGEREIREAAEALRKHHPAGYDILPLYSRLSSKEQAAIFKPHKKPRIVLATNVAETSLTVPGIRCVIDTGLARISRFSQRSKIQQLPIEAISQASANQRSGRCGREAAGICIRLFSEDDFNQRPEFTEPEILRTNLASVILQMKSLRLADINQFPFLEPPADKMIRSGVRSLHELGALDKNEKLTQIGRRLTHFPLDPQFGRMLLAAEQFQCLDEVLTIVSALSIQDPRERPGDKAKYADEKHKAYQNESSDFLSFLVLWREIQRQKKTLSNNQFRKYCRENFLAYMRIKDWEDIRRQLLDLVKKNLALKINNTQADDDAIHQSLLAGLVTRIGFKHEQAEYLGARNLKFYIHPASTLFKKPPKWLMAAEQVETTRVYGRTVASIKPEWIEKAAGHLIKHHYYEPHWSKKSAQGMVHEQLLLFGLTISKGRKVPLARTEPEQARDMFIRHGLVDRDMVCHAAFFRKNEKLLQEIEYEQQKGRRVD
ncbi:MAG: ATP-dependent RNA helicase HrpA, partial [Cycloclasticus pugetii]